MAWDTSETPGAAPVARVLEWSEFLAGIARAQREHPHMDAVRAFNHQMVDTFNRQRPISGRAFLDVGASWAGYSVERALAHGAALAAGVSLEIREPLEVRGPRGVGRLLPMNAEALRFDDGAFDRLLSLSTFEHFLDVPRVLDEMHRVLACGGSALFCFEPVWTSSYGHHLHHLGPVARLIPPWAHLLWTPERMRAALADTWPADAPMTLDEAVHWVYEGDQINRVPGPELRRRLEASAFEIEWIAPLDDDKQQGKPALAAYLAQVLPYSAQELMTRGYSLLLNKR